MLLATSKKDCLLSNASPGTNSKPLSLPVLAVPKPSVGMTRDLYTMAQKLNESAEDFIARVTKKAKYIPNIDESLLRSAVIQGLRPQIHSHVLQANVQTMADLLQAARVANVATTSSDLMFQQLLSEIRHSNEQHRSITPRSSCSAHTSTN